MHKNVLYIGDDKSYWETVKRRFITTYEHNEFDFIELPLFGEDEINNRLLDLVEMEPDFIFFDLCKGDKALLELGQFIKRITLFKHTPIVGFVDGLEKIENVVLSGFDFAFVKGAEIHDVVYHPYFFRYPNEAIKQDFALARFKKESLVTETFRVGFYAEDYMHFESLSQFSEGDVIKMRSNIPEECVLSKLYTIKSVSKNNLYYNTRFGYDVEYKILPDFNIDNSEVEFAMQIEDEKEKEKTLARAKQAQAQKQAEHEQKLKKMRKALKEWVKDNSDDSKAKKTKVLLIEEKLKFLEHDNRKLDSFSFTVRVQTSFDDDFVQIQKDQPHIIVYSIPQLDTSEYDFTDDELRELTVEHEQGVSEFFKSLIDKINTIDNYSPFLLIFNCTQYSSKAFQDTFKYDLILTNNDVLNFDIITQMAELYEKKQQEKVDNSIQEKILELRKQDPMKYGKLNKSDFVEPRYYIGKSHKLSKAYYDHKVELRAISESEVFFASNRVLPLSNYTLTEPFNMGLKLVPQKGEAYIKEGDLVIYKGLIHSIGEQEKKELRQFVNEIFTAHKKEAEDKEMEDFKKLNEQAASVNAEEANEEVEQNPQE